jgi:hypothetical protein
LAEQVAAKNRAVAEAWAREFAKVGIDTKALAAVGLANVEQDRAEMEVYRKRLADMAGTTRSPLTVFSAGRSQSPRNTLGFVRTPPFDIADGFLTPTTFPLPDFGLVGFDTGGGMGYFLDAPRTAQFPSLIRADTVMGIVFLPVLGNQLSPARGYCNIQAVLNVTMLGRATSVFSGFAESDAGIGWIVMELDQQGNFTRVAFESWIDQYDLTVGFGQAQSAFVNNPAYGISGSFITLPFSFYEIYAWQFGEVHAEGRQGPWTTYGNGFSSTSVSSIGIQWEPAWPFH